jgi:predicted transport protein
LSLNLHFPEIDDPRGMCRDVTNLGRWGNGDVEVRLEKPEDLTYIVGLVRQALEKQLGEEESN